MSAAAAGATPVSDPVAYQPGVPGLATITNGYSAAPWNLTQAGAVYPAAGSGTDGVSPYPSGTVGAPGPLAGYCGPGGNAQAATASPARMPSGTTLPLSPAYFPHIVRNLDGSLTGYFDYRPKDADEAIVVARSRDNGTSWVYEGQALEQNQGYCPNADINDDGEGHPNVLTVGLRSFLYTLQRPAGDNNGVGLLVHQLNPIAGFLGDPLFGVPASEQVGVDPDAFAARRVTVPASGGTAVDIPLTEPVGSGPEQLVAGPFVDLTRTPHASAADVITCTGVGSSALTGCTAGNSPLNVSPHDLLEQVIATSADTATVPAGPNTTTGDGGLGTLNVTPTNPNNLNLAILNANAPNRVYVDGVPVYCSQSNAFPTTKIENCTTGPKGSALSVAVGDPILSDPIVPATAQQTSGLVAPDGIVGQLPTYPGAPRGATIVMYTEKVLNYFVVGYTGGKSKFAANMSIPYTNFPNTSSASLGTGPSYTVSMGDKTTDTIVSETCSGLTTTATGGTLTGCNGGTVGDAIDKNTYLGAPGAATVDGPRLAQLDEGSVTNAQKLLKNNEDLTVLRVAYTWNGIQFSDAGLANGGVISGASNGAADYSDINNPAATGSPDNLNAYATPGTPDATEMRFVGAAGTLLPNRDGSIGLFLSGAWAADGDSDAYNQIFYTTSRDGEHWSIPTSVVSTDYTFSASVAAQMGSPLAISGYYSGRAYDPTVLKNRDGSLTMLFAGYRLPKPVETVGMTVGTDPSALYTVGADDPALYRNILKVTLEPQRGPSGP